MTVFPEDLLMTASVWLNKENLNKETKYKEICQMRKINGHI